MVCHWCERAHRRWRRASVHLREIASSALAAALAEPAE
jgi:hypothetical protein